MTPDHRVRVTSSLEVVDLDGELVVLNVDNGHYYGLNETGAQILYMAQEGTTIRDVYDAFVEKYDVTLDDIRDDVEAFVNAMEGYGMLRVEASGS